jgi:hypothetical protein
MGEWRCKSPHSQPRDCIESVWRFTPWLLYRLEKSSGALEQEKGRASDPVWLILKGENVHSYVCPGSELYSTYVRPTAKALYWLCNILHKNRDQATSKPHIIKQTQIYGLFIDNNETFWQLHVDSKISLLQQRGKFRQHPSYVGGK